MSYEEKALTDLFLGACRMNVFSLSKPIEALEAKKALALLVMSGQTEGAHHKAWAIDQAIRVLAGDDYERLVEAYRDNGEYSWDEGSP